MTNYKIRIFVTRSKTVEIDRNNFRSKRVESFLTTFRSDYFKNCGSFGFGCTAARKPIETSGKEKKKKKNLEQSSTVRTDRNCDLLWHLLSRAPLQPEKCDRRREHCVRNPKAARSEARRDITAR